MTALRYAVFSFSLVSSVAGAGSGDYALVLPDGRSCAKDVATCETARQAAIRGWLPDVPRGTIGYCAPSPGCFDKRSNCIPGYRGSRPEGYCR